ncbi:hypothetical protein BRC19_02235 [Candidatus Saccharibacteria bacterium QS_5_54_17]|nr:MAG: hypothetical protein BRC19_02235 [Candidatus Saccharibacteria bacterium QS_5_54_17]
MKIFKKHNREPKEADAPQQEYARLGKALTRAIVRDNIQVTHNWKRFITVNFVRGLFVGLGSVVGATLLVALVLWLLNVFGGLPIVGDWFEAISSALNKSSAAE